MRVQTTTLSGTKGTLLSSPEHAALGLSAIRYFILAIGAAILSWETAQVFWLAGGGVFRGMVAICLVALLIPVMVWVMNREERLRQALEE